MFGGFMGGMFGEEILWDEPDEPDAAPAKAADEKDDDKKAQE
jgi:hypothetical protein